jgi:hypothetical protein
MGPSSQTIQRLVVIAAGALLLLLLIAAFLPEEGPAPEQATAPSPTVAGAARATPSPRRIPTLPPSITPHVTPSDPQIRLGPWPEAMVDRGGLSLILRLLAPGNRLVAGSFAQVELQLQNRSQATIELATGAQVQGAFDAQVLDDLGQPLERDESWYRMLDTQLQPYGELPPGATVTQTIQIFIPPAESVGRYALWGSVRYIFPNASALNRGVRQLDSGPLPLEIMPPEPGKQIVAELQVENAALTVQVLEPAEPPTGLSGILATNGGYWNGLMVRELAFDGRGRASYPLEEAFDGVAVLVGAPGYASAVLTQTLSERGLAGLPPPVKTSYRTREQAQPHVPFDLVALTPLHGIEALEAVEVISQPLAVGEELSVRQIYELPDGWGGDPARELSRRLSVQQSKAGSVDFYNTDYVEVALEGRTGYARLRYGRWLLTWNNGTSVVTLSVPASQYELDNVIGLARRINSGT